MKNIKRLLLTDDDRSDNWEKRLDDIIKPSTNDKLFFSGQITITLLLGTSARTQEIFNRLMVTIDDSMYLTSDGRDDWNDGTSVVDDWLPD